MKRRPPAPRAKNQTAPTPVACHPASPAAPASNQYSTPLRLKRGRRVSYIPGERLREETPGAPRLFIRGSGGSIKMDLGGVGTRLSEAAFAHYVPDDSLVNIRIHRGDVVLIEPSFRAFRAGNLVLLEIDGRAVLKRLTKNNRLWYLNSVDSTGSAPVPLVDQPLQGVAVGLLRLFNPLKPVKFRGTDANCEISFARSGNETVTSRKSCATTATRSCSETERIKSSPSSVALAAEKKGKFRLSEVEKKSAYKAWPNTR